MKRFRFSLQAVLTVRQREEQSALEAYARSLLNRQQALEQLNAAEGHLARAWQGLRHQLDSGTAAADLQHTQNHCQILEQQKNLCHRKLMNAERTLNQSRREMLAARQQRQAVDSYYQKQKEEHRRLALREEQKLLDELAQRPGPDLLAWKPTSSTSR